MKTKTTVKFRRTILSIGLVLSLIFLSGEILNAQQNEAKKSIKIALLLDTSNSMDGLIEQAKSQLWNIVNELAKANNDGRKPELEISLYEYGNDNLNPTEGYIRQVTLLSKDLDLISEKLFDLKTNGGSEFCGYVITSALNQLNWDNSEADLKLIFIAGNEPFTQGKIDFRDACYEAKSKGVIVNTIFCGSFDEGISGSWKKGAEITGGEYMSINQNSKTVYIESPYDDRISELNHKLNDTYISYGTLGREKKQNQLTQDSNAGSYSKVNMVKRAASKASHVYKNTSWDLVDKSEEANFEIEAIAVKELPSEMQKMSKEEKTKYVKQKKEERFKIQQEILELTKKREAYVSQERAKNAESDVLDNSMINAIKKQAKTKKFEFDK